MKIRPETSEDYAVISEILQSAFANHPFSRQTEHLIVDALRADGALTVGLVAEEAGRVAGHVALSPVTTESGGRWFALGPIAVAPERQRRGIGKSLVEASLAALRAMNADGCILVGDPAYYERFGFRSYEGLTMEGVPSQYLMCLAFTDREPRGAVVHHQAFHAGLGERSR